jgi:hypothetical protein
MSYRNEESDIIVVKFSQEDGQQLLAILEHSIAQVDYNRLNLGALISALDSLSDANALARWMRENVAFELRPDEADTVLQALDLSRDCCKRCSSAAAALGGVGDSLRSCLATRCTTAGQTPAPPALTQLGSPSVLELLVAP